MKMTRSFIGTAALIGLSGQPDQRKRRGADRAVDRTVPRPRSPVAAEQPVCFRCDQP